jgi:glycosyltransferase involved in cell wall biosynthesis
VNEITVVMPTYNQGAFIAQSINSMVAQTYRDFELIIVNDGATDNTGEVIDTYLDYVQHGPVIRTITKDNGGTGSALNAGFKLSTGKYETWFSSDNVLYPKALSVMHDYLETHPDVDYVYCNCEIGIMDQTGKIELERRNLEREVNQEWKPENLVHHYFMGIVWLWRRELREKAGEFQLEPCEDYDMVLRMYAAGGRFAYIPKCLGWFRRHYGNMSWKIASSGDRDRYSRLVQNKYRKLKKGEV